MSPPVRWIGIVAFGPGAVEDPERQDMPVSDEESGGVRGLRAWAADAAERVKRLVPAMGDGAVVPLRAYDASVAELDQLERLLDHDPGLRSAVSVWLAGALTFRQIAGGGRPGDRERGEKLLRDVRDPATALGATATEEDRRWAALFLLPLLTPLQPQQGGFGVREGRAPRVAAESLWSLAEAYRERGVRNEDVQDVAALEAAKEALTALAADVLLQDGAEHGLLAARAGASRGVRAALWGASQGRLHEAVAALELGRALVLHAASTSSGVPELLDAGGHHALAEAWRAAGTAEGLDADDDGVPGELPSTLRRQALEALGYRREGGLLSTPTLSELADGIEESGADALVYLVPGEGENPGVVLAVSPRLGAAVGVRQLLSGAGSGPLERYLDATAVRDADRNDPSAEEAWEEALTALCDWAFEVLRPLLAEVEERLAAEGERGDRPLRLVLVPCGRLGIVPWHAARLPEEAPHTHLCQTTVISYAASGSQFLRTLRRAPREPAAAPVLLADPNLDLTHAEVEVMALRDAFYRRARMCGGIFELADDELTPGTPDDVLAFLADGTSLLHVASHGSAGTRPTVSALHLAAPEDTGETPADEAGPGRLTVTRLLDRPDQQAAREGPLVVLSACQTDLSTRDHDEALTLTTAFFAGGARDVVGSRWTTQDSASALLMAVFHHHLTVEGLSPVDALRAAQLWMLDPHRTNPGSLGGELLRQLARPDLGRIALWAAFIHQGHPGPGATGPGSRGETEAGTEGGNA
ncbi:CHAT domain-containing protein [Streptomyces sp. NPDC001816]|uniref:CHAT domain-containing protein n=1 Tax=Streptomyces sp. NPDC001816 TaxID=3364612 RepID=UPI0036A686B1